MALWAVSRGFEVRRLVVKLIISGCNGHMGRVVAELAGRDGAVETIAGFDVEHLMSNKFPVYEDPREYDGQADVVVDFSSPSMLDGLLYLAVEKKIPLVLCTTGYSEKQLEAVAAASASVPIFRSGNMSLGVNLLAELVRRACAVLAEDFDVEIVERHHRRKTDAPSGTALLLADAASDSLPYSPEYVFARADRRAPRAGREIGISSVRGGTIVGEHEVIFAGRDEVIELKHSAYSREIFASGALRAAKFLVSVKSPGLYGMSDMLTASQTP
jgi:4-hydroxy-tetrahydrodipicolinate reductase